MTPAVAPAEQRRRPRQLSLAGDLARRDVSERLGREVEPARRDVRPRRQPIGCSDGEGPTLENVLSGVWEGLLTAGVADCPVCGEEMKRGTSEEAGGLTAACTICGSRLT